MTRVFYVLIAALLLIVLGDFPQETGRLTVMEPSGNSTYIVQWDTDGVERSHDSPDLWRLTTDLGYDVSVEAAQFRLASFELVPCDLNARSARILPWAPLRAGAGHGTESPNPSKVTPEDPLDVFIPEQQFSSQFEQTAYCTFHQVFGAAGGSGALVVNVQGKYRIGCGNQWQEFVIQSTSAYEENTVYKQSLNGGENVNVSYDLDSLLDGVRFEEDGTVQIARTVLENLTQNTQVTVSR